MKCIKNTNNVIRRVSDDQARAYITSGAGKWNYIPKSEWKATRKKPKTKSEQNAKADSKHKEKPNGKN